MNMIENAKNSFVLLKKLKNTESAQLWKQRHPRPTELVRTAAVFERWSDEWLKLDRAFKVFTRTVQRTVSVPKLCAICPYQQCVYIWHHEHILSLPISQQSWALAAFQTFFASENCHLHQHVKSILILLWYFNRYIIIFYFNWRLAQK